jgi:hypothetical protein
MKKATGMYRITNPKFDCVLNLNATLPKRFKLVGQVFKRMTNSMINQQKEMKQQVSIEEMELNFNSTAPGCDSGDELEKLLPPPSPQHDFFDILEDDISNTIKEALEQSTLIRKSNKRDLIVLTKKRSLYSTERIQSLNLQRKRTKQNSFGDHHRILNGTHMQLREELKEMMIYMTQKSWIQSRLVLKDLIAKQAKQLATLALKEDPSQVSCAKYRKICLYAGSILQKHNCFKDRETLKIVYKSPINEKTCSAELREITFRNNITGAGIFNLFPDVEQLEDDLTHPAIYDPTSRYFLNVNRILDPENVSGLNLVRFNNGKIDWCWNWWIPLEEYSIVECF